MGNSPVMIHKEQLATMLPIWDTVVRAIHANLTADVRLGWAQEMYAFSLAMANLPDGPAEVSYREELLVQPPFDKTLVFDACKPALVRSAHSRSMRVGRVCCACAAAQSAFPQVTLCPKPGLHAPGGPRHSAS